MISSKTVKAVFATGAGLSLFATACDAPDAELDALQAPTEFRCAAFDVPGIGGRSTVTVNGSSEITGFSGGFDVFSNGLVQIAGTANIAGGVYSASSDVRLFDSAVVGGDITGYTLEVPDWIPWSAVNFLYYYRWNSYIGPTSYGRDPTSNSNFDFSMYGGDSLTLSGGYYYFTSLKLTGGATLRFTGQAYIVVDGPLEVSGGSRFLVDSGKDVLILGTDTAPIEFSGGADVTMRLYAPLAPVVVSGVATAFSGGLLGDTLQVSGSSTLEVTEDALHIWNPC